MITNNISTKKDDMTAEQQLAKYLDIYLYNRLPEHFKNFTRISDKVYQMQGIDFTIDYDDNGSHFIDEKAQLHYMDICLNTFAFEINFIGRDDFLHDGWLFNHDLKTDAYMLIWPQETVYHKAIISIDKKYRRTKIRNILKSLDFNDFETVECYLIKRDSIKGFLEDNGWDEQRIFDKADELRAKRQFYKSPADDNIDSFYFYFSSPDIYQEAPVNIVIRKNVLRRLAYKRFIVKKSGVHLEINDKAFL